MQNKPIKENIGFNGLCVSELCLGNSMPIVCVCQHTPETHPPKKEKRHLRGKIKPHMKHLLNILQHVSLRGCL